MIKINSLIVILLFTSVALQAQGKQYLSVPSKVDFDTFEKIAKEAKKHRKNRLVSLEKFLQMSKEENVIILDARSNAMYTGRHVKGAVNLNFADFTQKSLARVIPSFDTKILIYCNNNFDGDEVFLATKAVEPFKGSSKKMVTLALNIPTYINLYGYGYKNVYELSELVNVSDKRITFEGAAIEK